MVALLATVTCHAAMAQRKSEAAIPKEIPGTAVNAATRCLDRLSASGAEFTPAKVSSLPPSASALAATCAISDPVVLTAVSIIGQPASRISLPSKPLLSCEMAERFSQFVITVAIPLAKGTFNKPLISIETGPGFECRPRNRQVGAKMSSHAQGNAVDVSAITLAGNETRNVLPSNDIQARQFFDALRMAGCGAFSTVLGPGSDAFHSDHLHFDIEKRGHDGKSKFCQ